MLDYQHFLDSFFEQISLAGIDIDGLVLDHIAYQASSSSDYEELKSEFGKNGVEVREEVIGGRRVDVFALDKPLHYKQYSIGVLELIEPKKDQHCESALQHAEFILHEPFETYMAKYPHIKWDTTSLSRAEFSHLKLNFDNGITLKFLKAPILELITKSKKD